MAEKKTVLQWADEHGLTEHSQIVKDTAEIERLRKKIERMELAGYDMLQHIKLKCPTTLDRMVMLQNLWEGAKR